MDRRGVRTEHAVNAPPAASAGDVASGEESARVQAGQLIGRYRLLFPIAAGGMAEVWAAKPEGSGISRAVALKLVRPEFAIEAEYARMFIDEAVVASSIRHPNICETYELGRDEPAVHGDGVGGRRHPEWLDARQRAERIAARGRGAHLLGSVRRAARRARGQRQ